MVSRVWRSPKNRACIGVVADTHFPRFPTPDELLRELEGVDLIVHAGDLCDHTVLRALETVAPVLAVRGNCDSSDVCAVLPDEWLLEVGGARIILVHGHQGRTAVAAARQVAARHERVQCVVFGHSHQPLNRLEDGVLFFNPGSPTWKRRVPARTYGLLTVDQTVTGSIHLLSH